MKRTKIINVVLALVMVLGSLLTAVQPVSAAIYVINPGFETRDLTGWTPSNPDFVYVMTSVPEGSIAIPPKEPSNCAVLISNSPFSTSLSQNISASAGDSLSGWFYFVPGLDGIASATLTDANTNVTLFNTSAHSTAWVRWSYTLPSNFNGELKFNTSGGDENNWGVLGIDAISSQSSSTASAGGPYSVNEGGSVIMRGSYANPIGNVDYTWSWVINGTTITRTGPTVVFSAAGIYGTQDVVINLVASGNNISTATASTVVHVLNVAPIISFTPQGNDHIALGQYYFNSGIIFDPGYGNVYITVNYDDIEYVPQPNDPASQDNIYNFPAMLPGTSFTLKHKFSHQGLFNVLVSVTDSTGATDSKIIQVKVDVDNNTAPYITQPATTSYSAAVGQTISIKFASYDIDADPITITPTGMPSGAVFTSNGQINGYGTFTWNTTGATPGTYPMIFAFADGVLTAHANITLTVSASGTDVVIVVNNPPHAEAAGPYSSIFNKTNTVTLDASGSFDFDPGDVLTYQWDIDYNGTFDISQKTVTLNYETLRQYGLAAGPHPILLRVTDKGGLYNTDYTTLRLIAPLTFSLSPSAGAHGSINPSSTLAVEQGDSQEFSITPDPGYNVADVLVDSVSVGAVTTYAFTNINAGHTISASFLRNDFDVSLSSSTTPSDYGQALTFTAVISPSSSAISVPEGTVQFKVNDVNLGSPVALAAADSTGQRSASINVAEPLNAGNYSIAAVFTLTGVSSQTATLSQQINKITPVITWPNPSDIYYGTPLSSSQLNAWTTVDGTFIYDPAIGTTLGAGEGRPLNVSFVPSDPVNYNSSTALVNINVLKAAPDFSSLSSPSITVGTANIILGGNISLIPAGNVITITVNGISQRVTVLDDGSFSANFDTSLLSVGIYEITYSFAGDDNYAAVSDTRSLSVNAKIDPVITWANPADIFYGTALSSDQLNASADVSGTFIYDTAAGTLLNVGSHILKVDFAPGDSANYNTASKEVEINVLQASPAFSDLSNLMITEGATVATLDGKLTIVPSDSSVEITLNDVSKTVTTDAYGNFSVSFDTSALTAIGGPYTVNYGFAGTSNCLAASGEGSITVNAKINPVITWVNPADISYGTALSSDQLNASADVSGTLTYSPQSGFILDAGAGQTLSVTFVPDDTAMYNSVTRQVSINVLQIKPVFTILSNPIVVEGTTSTTLNGSLLLVPTDTTVAVSIGTLLQTANTDASGNFSVDFPTSSLVANGSGYTVDYSFAGNTNYSSASTAGSITVTTRTTPGITWNDPADIVYGTALSGTQLNAIANTPGRFTYTPASGVILEAGNGQTLSVSFVPNDTANYTNASDLAYINVTKAAPVFSALSSPAITAGSALTTLGGNISQVPAGSAITITVNGISQTAIVQAGGAFSIDFNTSTLTANTVPYAITYSYSATANYSAAVGTGQLTVNDSDISYKLTIDVDGCDDDCNHDNGCDDDCNHDNGCDDDCNNNQNNGCNNNGQNNGSNNNNNLINCWNNNHQNNGNNNSNQNNGWNNNGQSNGNNNNNNRNNGGNNNGQNNGNNNNNNQNNGWNNNSQSNGNNNNNNNCNNQGNQGNNWNNGQNNGSNCDNDSNDCNHDGNDCDNDSNDCNNDSDACTCAVTADPLPGQNGKYAAGTLVTLTANPETGSEFTGWSGDLTGTTSSEIITMSSDKTVKATFSKIAYTLTVTPSDNGNVRLSKSGPYHYGDVVTLTPVANPGYTFSGWNSNVINNKVNITGDTVVTATFTQQLYTLTINVTPSGSGSVVVSETGPYHFGDMVTLTPTANTGYTFSGWSSNVTSNKVTIIGNTVVTATFRNTNQSTNFVIWGGNKAKLTDAIKVGQTYTCWGSQWEKQVTAGNYSKNAAFKGWANTVSADGKSWTTAPGNSSNPPATIGKYISVLVSTNIAKKGSTISGNIVATVILEVSNPGSYQPDPGHPITGKVVSITLK